MQGTVVTARGHKAILQPMPPQPTLWSVIARELRCWYACGAAAPCCMDARLTSARSEDPSFLMDSPEAAPCPPTPADSGDAASAFLA